LAAMRDQNQVVEIIVWGGVCSAHASRRRWDRGGVAACVADGPVSVSPAEVLEPSGAFDEADVAARRAT